MCMLFRFSMPRTTGCLDNTSPMGGIDLILLYYSDWCHVVVTPSSGTMRHVSKSNLNPFTGQLDND